MREDPNHFYLYINSFKTFLEDRRFVENDVRLFDPAFIAPSAEMASQFASVRRLFGAIDDVFLDSLEDSERRLISECANTMRNTLQGVHQSALNGQQLSKEFVTQFTSQYQRLASVVNGIFLARFLAGASDTNFRQQVLTGVSAAMGANESALREVQKKADDVLARIQRDLTEAAVAKNANYFHSEARRYSQLSTAWGVAAFVWFVLLIGGASILAFSAGITGTYLADLKRYVPTIPDQMLLLQVLAAKLVVIGALTFVGVVIVRTFMSVLNAHLVNRHRAVSLDTYKFLLDGARTDADRQAIIQRAAEAVFAMTETGLIKSMPGGDSPLNTTINFPKLA